MFLNAQNFLIKGGNLERRPYEESIMGKEN